MFKKLILAIAAIAFIGSMAQTAQARGGDYGHGGYYRGGDGLGLGLALGLGVGAVIGSTYYGGYGYYQPYYGPAPYPYAPQYYPPAPIYNPPAYVVQSVPAIQPQPYCREYTNRVIVGGYVKESYGTACMQPDGSWRVIN